MKTSRRVLLIWILLLVTFIPVVFTYPVRAAKIIKVFKPKYTNGFSIEYLAGGLKRIRDNDGRTIWLIPSGKKVPAGLPGDQMITIPLTKGLFTSVTQVCLLRPFADQAVWKSITGVATPKDQWFIPPIKTGLKNGAISYIGDAYSPDYEKIQLLRPKIAFIYTGSSGLTDMTRKLAELRIPYVAENSYLETNPLGRMEWVKFYAAFYNKEAAADRYFEQVIRRIQMLKKRIPSSIKPKVAWGVIYNGKVYIPGSRSFVAEMITLAGGDNVFKNLSPAKGSVAISLEAFFAYSRNADIMIYASFPKYAVSIDSIIQTAPVLAKIKPFKTGKVWALQPWYNQQQDRTDQVLYDMAALFYPRQFKDYQVRNFKKLRFH